MTGRHIWTGACCLTGLVLSTMLAAQQPAFKAGVELVTVPVTVTSLDHNTYIDGLTAADFRLSENGDRQEVTVVTRERVPVSIAIIVDSSGSMSIGNRRELAVEATQSLVKVLLPEDEISIVFFGETLESKLPWTRIKEIASLDWSGWKPWGSTPLNDAMRAGIELTGTARNSRRIVLLVTDGFENSSQVSFSDIVKTRNQSEIAIYGFGVGSPRLQDLRKEFQYVVHNNRANAAELRRMDERAPGSDTAPTMKNNLAKPAIDYVEDLVGDSGGTSARMLTMPEATMAARIMADVLRYQYLVGYTPKKPLDGKYRKLKVEVNRKGTYVHHRGGYLALPSAGNP